QAFCSLCVKVGSFSDPPKVPGLAHFLQRMVFMGSEKYPKENGFNEFISHHGGTIDGVTDCEHTRFYFDISEKHLFPALDRFVQFFIKPLMKKDVIKSEREAIQREFQWSSSSDKNRKERLLSFIAQTGLPLSEFLRGNSIALNNDINDDELYEELHNFRNRHYSAHRMTLAIKARLSLDTLEVYVANFFSDIPNYWLHSDDFTDFKDGISFNTDTFKKIYYVKSFSQDISQLHVTWALPAIDSYRSKPYKYISWIIEHKGNGSLTSYLRKKMWGLDVFCGNCDNDNDFGYNSMYVLFEIIVELTHKGVQQHQQDVLNALFSFINFVKKTGPQESIYNELYKIGKNNFRFFKHDDVFDLCKSMHFYPSRDYVTGKHIYFEYDPEAIQKCLNFLMPETANIMILTNDFELNIVEPHFKINYIDMVLPKEWIERWKFIEPLSNFHLPSRNEFLTNNFFFIPVSAEASKYPVKIHQDCLSEIWFCPKFHWPVCHINLHIVSSLYPRTAKNAVLLQTYCNVIKYLLLEELYPAVTAGIGYEIDVNEEDTGITIQISGFNENLSSWLMIIANYMVNLVTVSTNLFNIIKIQQLKTHYNKFIEPETFIEDVELWLLKCGNCTHVHKYNVLQRCNYSRDFRNFVKSFTNNLYIQCLVQGNITKDFTIDIIQRFIKKIDCFALKKMKPVAISEIHQCTYYFKLKNINRTDVNSVVRNYYQVGTGTIELSVLIELLIMIMKESLMSYLRTQEKLSYVSCDFRDINGILGYSITVYTQADKCTTEYVDQWIEEFLNSFRVVLEQFSETELDDVKEGLRILKQYDDTDILKNQVDRNWSEIIKQQYIFDRCEKEALAIENININKLREFFGRHTLNGSNFRKLSIHVIGTPKEVAVNAKNLKHPEFSMKEFIIDDSQHDSATNHYITDVNYYKNTLHYFRL
ncbi:Nardilysin, partial [Trachymyrmex septentrionalis]